MKSTDMLIQEHELILKALTVLDALADRAARDQSVAREPIDRLVMFFTDFADRFHHAKEEGALFPSMEAHGFSSTEGPVAVMLHEHEQGRVLLRAVADAAQRLGEQGGRGRFADAAHAYELLLGQHIDKENAILFPMAAAKMDDAEDERLLVAFAEREREVLGQGKAAALRGMIADLAAKFA